MKYWYDYCLSNEAAYILLRKSYLLYQMNDKKGKTYNLLNNDLGASQIGQI